MTITLDELRSRVAAAINSDARFPKNADGKERFWIREIIMDSESDWTAIINDNDTQKLSKIKFTIGGDDDTVTLSSEGPRSTEIIYAEDSGILKIRAGKRGSKDNPAEITGAMFCVGTLTNKPAFAQMEALFAERHTNQTAAAAATTQQRRTMRKVKLTKDRDGELAGATVTIEDEIARAVLAGGGGIYAEDAAFAALESDRNKDKQEKEELQKELDKHHRARAVQAVAAAVKRGAIHPKQTIKKIADGKEFEAGNLSAKTTPLARVC